MFRYPRYVIKAGEIVVEEGDIKNVRDGHEFVVKPTYDEKIEDFLKPLFQQQYTMSFENYPVELDACMDSSSATLNPEAGNPFAVRAHSTTTCRVPGGRAWPDRMVGLANEAIRALPVYLGKRQCRLDEFFDVDGESSDQLEIHGDAAKVKWIGRDMTRGRIKIHGNAGMHLGAYMKGGTIEVTGNGSDWIGGNMRQLIHTDNMKKTINAAGGVRA